MIEQLEPHFDLYSIMFKYWTDVVRVSHLLSSCLMMLPIWFVFSSKRPMMSLFCFALLSELYKPNTHQQQAEH